MKGAIFKHFEAFVSDNWGEDFYEDVFDAVTLVTPELFEGRSDLEEFVSSVDGVTHVEVNRGAERRTFELEIGEAA